MLISLPFPIITKIVYKYHLVHNRKILSNINNKHPTDKDSEFPRFVFITFLAYGPNIAITLRSYQLVKWRNCNAGPGSRGRYENIIIIHYVTRSRGE